MTLDTNILIYYYRNQRGVVRLIEAWKRAGHVLTISSVSVTEMLSVPNMTASEVTRTVAFLQTFLIIPFDGERAVLAGTLRRTYRLSTSDAVIAATALSLSLPLVTNDQDFHKVRELELIVP